MTAFLCRDRVLRASTYQYRWRRSVTPTSWPVFSTLYVGVTSDLEKRVWEHKTGFIKGFTSKYRIVRLVHCEEFGDIADAIGREKQIKGWRREKKLDLIEQGNPLWSDLARDWFK